MADTVPAPTSSSELLPSLQSRIQALSQLSERLHQLRKIPAYLFRPPSNGLGAAFSVSPHLQVPPVPISQPNIAGAQFLSNEFRALGEVKELVRSEKVQEALTYARDSELKDKTDLSLHKRRENRKRKRQPSPESPQFVSLQSQHASLFPPDDGRPSVTLRGLVDLLTDHNREYPHVRSQIVSTPERSLEVPVVLRVTIRDVAIVFLTLNVGGNSSLIVENATALGPREQKPYYSQSDFNVYQKLSQQITKMIQSEPQVSLPMLLNLLASYENLFLETCASCQRILSTESHIPPVARVWSGRGSDEKAPRWTSWHPTCLQR